MSDPFGRQWELGLLGPLWHSQDASLCHDRPRRPNSGWRPYASDSPLDSRGTRAGWAKWAI